MKIIKPFEFTDVGSFTAQFPYGGFFDQTGVWRYNDVNYNSANTRRISYEPTPRALIEDESINLLIHSEDFSYWTGSADISVIDTSAGINLTLINDNDGSNTLYRYLDSTVLNDNSLYYCSIFLRQWYTDNDAIILLQFLGGSTTVSTHFVVDFDAVTITNVTTNEVYSLRVINPTRIDSAKGPLVRAEIPFQNNGTGNTTLRFVIYPSGQGDVVSTFAIFGGGAQVEKNANSATSYIPTESSHTNIITYSEDYSYWNGLATVVGVVDSSHGLNITRIQDSDASFERVKTMDITVANDSEYYYVSFYIRQWQSDNLAAVRLQFLNGSIPITKLFTIDFSTQTIVGDTTKSLRIIDQNIVSSDVGKLFKAELVVTNNSTGNTLFRVGVSPSGPIASSVGSVCVGGFQVEKGVYFGEYIKTLASPVTAFVPVRRNPDINLKTYYSSIPQPDYNNGEPGYWVAGTNYVVGDRCIYNTVKIIDGITYIVDIPKIYECIVDHLAVLYPLHPDAVPQKWVMVGSTNAFSLLDNELNTVAKTSLPEGLVFVFHTLNAIYNSMALLNLNCPLVDIIITRKSKIIEERSINTTGISDYVITDFPALTDLDICVYLHVILPEQTASLGKIIFGNFTDIGGTQYGAIAGITDYSVKSVDGFGNYTIVKRNYAKRTNYKLSINSNVVDEVYNFLADLRSTLSVFVGSDNNYSCLIVYGFYKDFEIDISYPSESYCTLEVEGIV